MRTLVLSTLLLLASPALAIPLDVSDIEMAGDLELKKPPEALFAAWLKLNAGKTEYDLRDEQWWLQSVVLVEGRKLHLYETARGDQKRIEHHRAFLTMLSEAAKKGHLFLHHLENGYSAWSWDIVNGKVVQGGGKGLEKMPKDSAAARHFLATREAQRTQLAGRLPSEAFRELAVRKSPELRAAILDGADSATRKATAKALHEASGRSGSFVVLAASVPLPKELEPESTVFVDDIESRDTWIQQAMLEAIRKNQAALMLGSSDIAAAKASGKLRADLYTRLADSTLDVRKLHP
jgi:hypothetical protein